MVQDANRQRSGVWAYRTLTRPVRNTLKRYRVVKRLSAIFDVTLGPLALVGVSLLIIELLVRLSSPWDLVVYGAQVGLWIIFFVAFVIELSLAPQKLSYLKRNWLLVLALGVPALRIFRFARALQFLRSARAVRGANVVRSFTSLNRALAAIQSFLGFSQLAYLAALTAMVWLAGSGLVYYLESTGESGIDTVGDALWWGAAVLTTVSIATDPISDEGRFVAIVMRLFGVAIVGYFTARMAAYFFGSRRQDETPAKDDDVLQALRVEIAALREELRQTRTEREPPAS